MSQSVSDSSSSRAAAGSRPTSIEEAAELLAAASTAGRTVRIGTDLLTDGLDRILEHEAGDLTCTVEAGVRLSALRQALGIHGQRLALDPPGDPTVGACIAGNLSGPLRHRFGAPRDLVLGVTLVLADGTIASAGGKVVKNVAGYDLAKLVCGSRGSLALIARIALRLHPVPPVSATHVTDAIDAASAASAVFASQLQPSALDVLHPGRCAVLFEGTSRAVRAQLDSAESLVGGHEADGGVWDESRELQSGARGTIRFAPGLLAATLAPLREALARPGPGIAYVPHVVGGVPSAGARRLTRSLKARFDPLGTLVGGGGERL